MNDAEIIANAIEADYLEESDAITYAAALVRTGMVNSTGSLQRFVADIAAEHGDRLARAIAGPRGPYVPEPDEMGDDPDWSTYV